MATTCTSRVLGAYCNVHRVNPVVPRYSSPSHKWRLVKYWKRGFHIVFLDLEWVATDLERILAQLDGDDSNVRIVFAGLFVDVRHVSLEGNLISGTPYVDGDPVEDYTESLARATSTVDYPMDLWKTGISPVRTAGCANIQKAMDLLRMESSEQVGQGRLRADAHSRNGPMEILEEFMHATPFRLGATSVKSFVDGPPTYARLPQS